MLQKPPPAWRQDNLSFSPRLGIALHALLFVITIWPLWQTRIPAFVDYPNHLARMHILLEHWQNPDLQHNYEIKSQIAPYIAMEAVVLPLARWIDLETAGKLFILLGLILTAGAVIALQILINQRISILSFLVYPLLYSNNLGWGFIQFVFS